MRCKPGDLAVIISEDLGCEENMGAMLTCVEPFDCGWLFKDASRPLLILDEEDAEDTGFYATHSYDPKALCWMPDFHLKPIPRPAAEAKQAQHREVELSA